MEAKSRTVEIATLTMRPDGILHTVVDFTGTPTADAAAEYLAARAALVGAASPPVLLQLIRVPYVERAIRAVFVADLGPTPCRAIVSVDPMLVTVWRSFELLEAEKIPTEVFSNLNEACDWIKEIMAATPRKP